MKEEDMQFEQTQNAPDGGKNRGRRRKKKKELPLWMSLILVAVMVFVFRTYVMGTASVKGSSMEPTFSHGDLVFMNKLTTTFHLLERDDIVVCEVDLSAEEKYIIKRVIGVAGDEIDIVPSEEEIGTYVLYVNGTLLQEDYINGPMQELGDVVYPYTVPEGSYFVMGDNRNASTDSRVRSIGAIDADDMLGEVVLRLYPLDGFGLVK